METELSPNLLRILHPSLREKAFDSIKIAAMRGELKPGQRVTELGLASKLGVGQATVREALVVLELRGFVQRRNRETRITALSRSDVEAIYAVRLPLEKLAVELVALKNDRNLAGLEDAYRRMLTGAQSGQLTEFKEMDLAFHSELWKETGNSYLQNLLEHLVPQLFAFAIIAANQDEPTRKKLGKIAKLHGRILEALRVRDLGSAQEALVASMDRTWIRQLNSPADGLC